MLIIECPECGARNEISDLRPGSIIRCQCAGDLEVRKRTSDRPQEVNGSSAVCAGCGRLYNPRSYRPGSEILCTCGNALIIPLDRIESRDGRRREDRERVLQQEELLALIDVCKLMNAAVETESLLRTVMKLTASMLKAEGTTMLLKTPQGNELVFYAVAGDKASDLQHMRIAGDKGVVGWVVQKGVPAVVNDAATDERFNSEVDQATDFSTRSILCVPLRVNDAVIGALEAVNKKSPQGFSERDMALAEAIASQAAEAIQRAHLVEENMRRQRLAVIGETVAGLAHCIRNILNGLKGGAYMVNSGLKSDTKEHLERGWDMVQRNIEHVSDLALGMLDYSKDRAPVLEQADANEMLVEIVKLTEEKARSRAVALTLEAGSDVVPFRFDAQSVRRCVMNLVSNAIDACNDGKGTVTVRSRVPDEKWVELSVTDNGCGMSPEVKDKLFTSLFSTKGSKGTGLGLPVTRKILREHGGDLLVESEEGRGSTFTCRLPFRTQE